MADRQIDVGRRHVADPGGQEAEFNRVLGERIRAARVEVALTQEQLARQLGVARGSIANLERGAQAPSAYRLARLAEALGRNLGELLPQLNDHVSVTKHESAPEWHRVAERAKATAARKRLA